METRKYSTLASVVLVIAVLTFCLRLPVTAVSAVPLYSMDDLAEIMVVGTSFHITETLLLTARTVAGGIVASVIIIVATRDIIEKIVSTTRRRLIFGHHPGPPRLIVWLFSLARALEGMNVYFADILTRHNNIKVDTVTPDGRSITDSPFSLGVTNNGYITA